MLGLQKHKKRRDTIPHENSTGAKPHTLRPEPRRLPYCILGVSICILDVRSLNINWIEGI